MPSLNTGNAILSNAITVDGSYNVGIGGSPSGTYKLEITGEGRFYQSATSTTAYLRVENNRTRNAAVYTATTNGGFYAGTSIGTDTFNYQIYDGVAGAARLTISSTGAATFSAATSAITLTANGAANQWTTKILASSTTSQSYGLTVQAGTNSTDIGFQVIPVSGSGSLLYVRGDGNVGIGTTSPTSYADRTLQLNNSSTNSVYLKFTNSTTGSAIGDGFDIGMFGVDTYLYNREAGATIFATNDTEKMRLTSGNEMWLTNSNTYSTSLTSSIIYRSSTISYGVQPIANIIFATEGDAASSLRFVTRNGAADYNERMRITSGGVLQLSNSGIANSYGNTQITMYGSGTVNNTIQLNQIWNGLAYPTNILGTNATGPGGSASNGFRIQTSYYNGSGVSTVDRFIIDGYNGIFYMPGLYANTYGNAANVYIGADNAIGRSTSSLKYKKNVIDYEKGLNELMQLRPVSYESKNPKEDGLKFAGFIAEEVHDLGLTEFVQYAEDGTPDALAYTHMISLLTKAIQEQQAQIEAQQQQINQLINR